MPAVDRIGLSTQPVSADAAGSVPARLQLRRATQDFEALLLAHLLRTMRSTTDGLVPDPERTPGDDVMRDVMDEQVAVALARRGGIGLARMLEDQMQNRGTPAASPSAAADSAPATPQEEAP